MQTTRINLISNAPTQYTNFNFISMCMVNGIKLGAGPNGISKLCYGDSDNGATINAYFIPHTIDFGNLYWKRLRRVYLGGRFDGNLNLTVTGNDHIVHGPYNLLFYSLEKKQAAKFPINRGKGFKWVYADFKFENVDGSFFAIDSALALYKIHHKRRLY